MGILYPPTIYSSSHLYHLRNGQHDGGTERVPRAVEAQSQREEVSGKEKAEASGSDSPSAASYTSHEDLSLLCLLPALLRLLALQLCGATPDILMSDLLLVSGKALAAAAGKARGKGAATTVVAVRPKQRTSLLSPLRAACSGSSAQGGRA